MHSGEKKFKYYLSQDASIPGIAVLVMPWANNHNSVSVCLHI